MHISIKKCLLLFTALFFASPITVNAAAEKLISMDFRTTGFESAKKTLSINPATTTVGDLRNAIMQEIGDAYKPFIDIMLDNIYYSTSEQSDSVILRDYSDETVLNTIKNKRGEKFRFEDLTSLTCTAAVSILITVKVANLAYDQLILLVDSIIKDNPSASVAHYLQHTIPSTWEGGHFDFIPGNYLVSPPTDHGIEIRCILKKERSSLSKEEKARIVSCDAPQWVQKKPTYASAKTIKSVYYFIAARELQGAQYSNGFLKGAQYLHDFLLNQNQTTEKLKVTASTLLHTALHTAPSNIVGLLLNGSSINVLGGFTLSNLRDGDILEIYTDQLALTEAIQQRKAAEAAAKQAPKLITFTVTVQVGNTELPQNITISNATALDALKKRLETDYSIDAAQIKLFLQEGSNWREVTAQGTYALRNCSIKQGSLLRIEAPAKKPIKELANFFDSTSGKVIGVLGAVSTLLIIYKLVQKYRKRKATASLQDSLTPEQQMVVQKLVAIFTSDMSLEEQENAQAVLFTSYAYSEAEQQALVNLALSRSTE